MDEKMFPEDFPLRELKPKLESLINKNALEIKEKEIQDMIYDILEKKNMCTIERLAKIYMGWEKWIEYLMTDKKYVKTSDFNENKYVLISSITK